MVTVQSTERSISCSALDQNKVLIDSEPQRGSVWVRSTSLTQDTYL